MKKIVNPVLLSLLLPLIGCTPNLSKFEGNYVYEKKVDEADGSETLYSKGTNRFNHGYTISVQEDGLLATPAERKEGEAFAPSSMGKALSLNQTDDDIFQFKKSDDSLVLTFAFTDPDLMIMEYTRDASGNFQKESTLYLKKIR